VPVKVDCSYGPETERAVRLFQTKAQIPVDGIAGPRTFQALHRRTATRRTTGGSDPFDPGAYLRWLAALPGDAVAALFGEDDDARARPERKPAPAAPKPAPRLAPQSAPKPTPSSRPDTATVSRSQNRKHSRISFDGFAGRGYVVKDFKQYEGYVIKLLGGVVVRPHDSARLIKNECAQFVQFFGVPRTKTWRRGPQLCFLEPGSLPVGTVVATLRDGMYHNDYSGRSHVGIYLGHDPHAGYQAGGNPNAALYLFDQFNKNPIMRRRKRYRVEVNAPGRATKAWIDGAGHRKTHRVSWGADGEEYFVLMTHD
jgi:hypothetical protein